MLLRSYLAERCMLPAPIAEMMLGLLPIQILGLQEHFSILQLADFTGINSKNVEKVWPSVASLIRLGLAEGEELETIHSRIKDRTCQLWAAYEGEKIIAACVTELPTIAGRKVCNIISVGGSQMEKWLQNMGIIEIWAKSQQCTAMRFPEIRPGWAKILKDYRVTKVNLEKAL